MSGDHLNKLQLTSISISCTNGIQQQLQQSTPIAMNHRYVKLNVGGRIFITSIDTLTKQDNMLRGMLRKLFIMRPT